MKIVAAIVAGVLLLPAVPSRAVDFDDDVYGEDAIKSYKEGQRDAREWKEQALELPAWPDEEQLVRIDLGRKDFPYKVFVDRGSMTLGKDRVVRYTVLLRSKSGVDNVSFEGIRCDPRQYKRYAYGSGGEFHTLPKARWNWIQDRRQDIYRKVLADSYFCPLPGGDQVPQLVRKLEKRDGNASFIFQGDLE
jgi:hypothetical protein